jgi:hypothetical protein
MRYSLMVDVILLFLLIVPHAGIGLAWWFYFRSLPGLRLPRWRSVPVLLALVTGSLNLLMYWGWVLWLQRNYTDQAWRVKESCSGISDWLVVITIAGGLFARGRVRLGVCVAGILGFFLWVTTAIGFL